MQVTSDPSVRESLRRSAKAWLARVPRPLGTRRPLGPWFAALLAGVALALVNSVAITWWLPVTTVTPRVRLARYVFELGQHVALSLLLAAAWVFYRRMAKPWSLRLASWRARRWLRVVLPWAWTCFGLVLLLAPTLAPDFSEFAHSRAAGMAAAMLENLLLVSCAAALTATAILLARHWRPWLAGFASALACALFGLNHWVFKHNYPGVHFFIAVTGLLIFMVAWAPLRFFRGRPKLLTGWAMGLALLCVLTLTIPPSQTLLQEQLKADGSVAPVWLTRMRRSVQYLIDRPMDAASAPWFEQPVRAATPSTHPGLLHEAPIILMVTIDAVRADVLERPAYLHRFATLSALKQKAVYFAEARAPGSQTVTSLSGVFSGRYFSQQYWTRHPAVGYLFLGDDAPARFPELLAAVGFDTQTVAATYFLVNTFGVVRGFEHERFIKVPGLQLADYTPGRLLTRPLLRALEGAGQQPLFLYAHYLDTHFPYKAGGNSGTPFERYLRSIEYVDRELGKLVRKIEQLGLWRRTLLVVASDHGEAFGEHNSQYHATTLYEEQLHVPLLVVAEALKPRTVRTMVSLIDLGPTLLDLAGQQTPGYFMGQTLVPLLRGADARLSRPIVAEGRLKKAMYFSDGYKLIVDDKNGTQELYYLKRDPKELRNVIDLPNQKAAQRVSALRRFFEVHTIRRSGYQVPYRP